MSMPGPARAFMSIGEVLDALRPEFPEVTISKIRFLESEGLITPERTPSGYRKFSREDVSRLTYVLAAQRDHYLPLRVIKDHLDAIDRGLEPPDVPGGPPKLPRTLVAAPDEDALVSDTATVRLSRRELLAAADITEETLGQLEQAGLISARAGHFDQTALTVAQTVAELAQYGIQVRHLRAFRTAADREVGLFEQVVTPLVRQRRPEAQGRAEETAQQLAALSVRLHAALIRAGLRSVLGNR
jgi:DNA-binding transcriptional MerR regulator